MKLVLMLVSVGIVALGVFSAYVRLAPSDPQQWHVDPREAEFAPGPGRYLLRDGAPSDGPAPRFEGAPAEVLGRFDAIARATPRVDVLAGSVADGRVTYVARSRLFGFPDYVSVVASEAENGTALSIYSRLRFGRSDLGVNARRVSRWLARMG